MPREFSHHHSLPRGEQRDVFKITDGILRSMIIRKDERKVKPQKAADKASEVEEVKAQAEEAAPVAAEETTEEATEA